MPITLLPPSVDLYDPKEKKANKNLKKFLKFFALEIGFGSAVKPLPSDKLRKEAVLCNQLVIFAVFDDLSVIQHEDPVALLDGRKPVRNYDSGAFQ